MTRRTALKRPLAPTTLARTIRVLTDSPITGCGRQPSTPGKVSRAAAFALIAAMDGAPVARVVEALTAAGRNAPRDIRLARERGFIALVW